MQQFYHQQQLQARQNNKNGGGVVDRNDDGGSSYDYFNDRRGGGNAYYASDSDGRTSSGFESSGATTVDFASYLLTRHGEHGGNHHHQNNNDAMFDNHTGLTDQQVQQLLGSDDFPSRELISFVGTRFPILQHALLNRETRFIALVVLARWLDLGILAVECCELFSFFRELMGPLWVVKSIDDQDPLFVMIGAKTALIDTKLLIFKRSLSTSLEYCSRVFVTPQELKDPSKLAILGQPNTQRWFASGAIALVLLRDPSLTMKDIVKSDPAHYN